MRRRRVSSRGGNLREEVPLVVGDLISKWWIREEVEYLIRRW